MPTSAELLALAVRHQQNGHLEQAVALYRQIIAHDPVLGDAHYNLGLALQKQGQIVEAMAAYQQLLRLNPNHVDARNNLGVALKDQGQLAEAVACYQQVLRLNPNHVGAYNNLGTALCMQNRPMEAAAAYRQALRMRPDFADAHNNLGNALFADGHVLEALECFEQATRLQPDYAQAHFNKGNVFFGMGRLDEALASFERALQLNPNLAGARNNLGGTYQDQGRLDEAIACYWQAHQLEPKNLAWHSNYLFAMLFHPRYDCAALLEELRRWEREHARALAPLPVPRSQEDAGGSGYRLRIGYVSPDFRDHVLGRIIWPLLCRHDHRQFEITLYANLSRPPDAMTKKLRQCADHWRDIAGMGDGAVAERIRQDRIDILVDLTLHMAGNRLLVFARKPAPMQVTYGGYPGTTGLTTIDYRLTDSVLDPPGLFDTCYTEKTYRLPHTFWCYDPQTEEPTVAPLPALKNGFITFGSLNNFCKVNDGVLNLWARVLRAVDGSRLLLLAPEGSHRRRTFDFLDCQGIAPERIAFSSRISRPEYLALYHQIDIGLDTFPSNGHTTSMDSYWMGVPVVTLVGHTVVGRAGLSQLTNLGLTELAAKAPEDFVRLAVDLANDLPRLQALRTSLRDRMKRSPLMDAVGFTHAVEEAYRVMWREKAARKKESGVRSQETGENKTS